MKKKIYILLIATFVGIFASFAATDEEPAQQTLTEDVATENTPIDLDELWARGNRLYSAGDYNGAVASYDSIVNAGWESAPLYYNLAGAYFKAGKSGKAILNYRRAARLDPSNDNIAYNLAYAESYVKDKIDEVPQFMGRKWVRVIGNLMSPDGWAVLSLVALGVMLASVVFYILAQRRAIRKCGFVTAVVMAVVLIVSVSFGISGRNQLLRNDEAVVLSSAAVVKASPERTGKDLFILHEGTTVVVIESFGEWSEIRIADGNEGWIRTSAIEII